MRGRWSKGLLPFVVVFVALAVPILWIALTRLQPPSDGTLHYYASKPPRGGISILRAPGPLEPGDSIIAINGRPLREWLTSGAREHVRKGDVLVYSVAREPQAQHVPVVLGNYPLRSVLPSAGGAALLLVMTFAVSVVVILRRPRDPAARTLFAIPVLLSVGGASWPFGPQIVELIRPYGHLAYVGGGVANALVWGAMLHLALVLPGPLQLVRRRPWLVPLGYGLPFVLYAAYLLIALPQTDDPVGRLRMTLQVSLPAARTYPILLVAVVVIGFFTRGSEERRRTRWVWAVLGGCSAVYLLLGQLPQAFGQAPLPPQWLTLVLLPIPLAVGEAILRRRLFDVQLVFRRSLVFGLLTGCLLVLYLLTAYVLAKVLGQTPAALAATALVALSVHPLRIRLQRVVGRRIFGQRHEPLAVTSRLGRIDLVGVPERVIQQVVATLAKALRLSYCALELGTPPDDIAFRAAYGAPSGTPHQLPLTYAGQPLGRLFLGVSPGSEAFGAADERLLDELARQVGMTGYTLLLAAELQRSRERIVGAREEERRRLRRDLHDGLGASLTATAIQLEIARDLVSSDPDTAEATLSRLLDRTRQDIAAIRRLVDDLRPPALDQLGLVQAIRERATYFSRPGGEGETPLNVSVEAQGDFGHLPAAVEVAAFHIVMEAVNNAARHGQATKCRIRLDARDMLSIEVTDNGRGLPADIQEGVGLSSMRERAAEVAGSCSIENIQGGTVVQARLPVSPSVPNDVQHSPPGRPGTGQQHHDSGTLAPES
jgi:signal transduction histidine kinase